MSKAIKHDWIYVSHASHSSDYITWKCRHCAVTVDRLKHQPPPTGGIRVFHADRVHYTKIRCGEAVVMDVLGE